MSDPILCARNLRKDYPRQRVDAGLYAKFWGLVWGWTGRLDEWPRLHEGLPVLKGVDLDIEPGEILAVVGPSGAGKSTLLHLLGALDAPSEGSVIYRGQDLSIMPSAELARWRNEKVGFVFQFYHLFPDLSAHENVLIPAMVAYGPFAYAARRAELHERAKDLLDRVGLGDRLEHRPSQLSGGEQQRVAIARALLLQPELLLCDEPTGNLDRKTGEAILEILFELKESDGQTYVIVTHDERLADRADRLVRMVDGRVVEEERRPAADPAKADAPAAAPAPAQEGGPAAAPAQEGGQAAPLGRES